MLALLAVAMLVATVFPSVSFADITEQKPSLIPPAPHPSTTAELLTSYTEASWGTQYDPFNTGWHDVRAQTVYLASDMSAVGMVACTISSVELKDSIVPGINLVNFRIRMQLTSSTTSSSYITSGWTDVYGPSTLTTGTFSPGSWYSFSLTTTFVWDGTNNLLIDFSRDGTSYSGGGGMYYRTALGTTRMCSGYSDSGYAYPFDSMPEVDFTSLPSIKMTYTPLNLPPGVPSLDNQLQMDNAKVPTSTPRLKWSVPQDTENNPLNFSVQVDDDSDFSSPLFTRDSSVSPTGFSGSPVASELHGIIYSRVTDWQMTRPTGGA
jgi:hypothetical protein